MKEEHGSLQKQIHVALFKIYHGSVLTPLALLRLGLYMLRVHYLLRPVLILFHDLVTRGVLEHACIA